MTNNYQNGGKISICKNSMCNKQTKKYNLVTPMKLPEMNNEEKNLKWGQSKMYHPKAAINLSAYF